MYFKVNERIKFVNMSSSSEQISISKQIHYHLPLLPFDDQLPPKFANGSFDCCCCCVVDDVDDFVDDDPDLFCG